MCFEYIGSNIRILCTCCLFSVDWECNVAQKMDTVAFTVGCLTCGVIPAFHPQSATRACVCKAVAKLPQDLRMREKCGWSSCALRILHSCLFPKVNQAENMQNHNIVRSGRWPFGAAGLPCTKLLVGMFSHLLVSDKNLFFRIDSHWVCGTCFRNGVCSPSLDVLSSLLMHRTCRNS